VLSEETELVLVTLVPVVEVPARAGMSATGVVVREMAAQPSGRVVPKTAYTKRVEGTEQYVATLLVKLPLDQTRPSLVENSVTMLPTEVEPARMV